ncbi:MAG: hypothetical protein CMJ46_00980 [Planctomyces sp.]|nr:hypothetical protein [Planctomyces sp.]
MATSISQLGTALQQAVATGQVGQAVSMRARVTAPTPAIPAAINSLMAIATDLLHLSGNDEMPTGRFRARRHPSGLQMDVLLQAENGVSLSLTWVRYEDQPAAIKLLLIGNHGIVRLEEGLAPDWAVDSAGDVGLDWYAEFERAIVEKSEVVVLS